MILVLAESSLELVPRELWSHPTVARDVKRGRGVLDRARHHWAMRSLPDSRRRGRPDIVHQSLLAFQYSQLAKFGKMYVHTIDDHVIEVRPDVRPPRNYNNFISLVAQLYKVGQAPPRGEPLMKLTKSDLYTLLQRLGGSWVVMHERGERKPQVELGHLLRDTVVVVGGFPHGDFVNKWLLEGATAVYRLGDVAMDAPQVVCRVVSAVESAMGLI